MKRLHALAVAITLLAGFGGPAAGATTVKSGKSNSSDRMAVDKASPKLMTGRVSAVDPRMRSFTVTGAAGMSVFSAAQLRRLPSVGETVDVTYTENPGGSLEAVNLNSSKSNVD